MASLLIVEDDVDLREQLTFVLENRGYQVETTANGAEALRRLERDELPGLILLDLMMPVMDGWTFRAQMLTEPRLAKIPVVVLSGVSSVAAEAQRLAASSYLGKPIELAKLYRLLDEHGITRRPGGPSA